MGHVRALLACALAAALGAAVCIACAPTPARHVVILGLDAGSWDLLDPLIARGLLPNLAWLRDHGATSSLEAGEPRISPAVWTSIATGKTPEKHGITSFLRRSVTALDPPTPVTRTMRRGKAFWNILGEAGFDVAIVGWPVTWPIEELNGRMISDRAHYGEVDEKGVFPPSYLSDLRIPSGEEAKRALRKVLDFDDDPTTSDARGGETAARTSSLIVDRFVRAWIRDTTYLRAAERVLDDGLLPRVLALYLRGAEDVQRGLVESSRASGSPEVSAARSLQSDKMIERYWQWTDTAIGRILTYYEDSSRLVLVVSGARRERGIFIAEGPGVRVGATLAHASVYDVTPTLLAYLGLARGADMDGRVIDGLFTGAGALAQGTERATYDEASTAAPGSGLPPLVAASDAKVLEDLRSLGYVE